MIIFRMLLLVLESSIKIKSIEHYEQLQYDDNVITGKTFVSKNPGSWADGIRIGIIDAKADQVLTGIDTTGINGGASNIAVGMGITQTLVGKTDIGAGTTTALTGHLKGMITEVGVGQISVKVLSQVDGATETAKDYQEGGVFAFTNTGNVAIHTASTAASFGSTAYTARQDWFSQQTVAISTSTVGGSTVTTTQPWNTVADRPGTSQYAADRGARFDEVHVVIIDGDGKVTGNAGTILEKHLNLSKATDAEYSAGSPSYWRNYLKTNSAYIFGGDEPAGTVTHLDLLPVDLLIAGGYVGIKEAEGTIFKTIW